MRKTKSAFRIQEQETRIFYEVFRFLNEAGLTGFKSGGRTAVTYRDVSEGITDALDRQV